MKLQSKFIKRTIKILGEVLEVWETDDLVVRRNGEDRNVDGVIVDGVLCRFRVIKGKLVFIPCLSKILLEQRGLLEKAKRTPGHEVWNHEDLMACALRLGHNEDGSEVINMSERRREERRRKEEREPVHLVWYATDYEIWGDLYALSRRVDEATWRKIAPYMMKWEAEDPLMVEGPKRGWVARDPRRVEELLDVPHELRLFCQCHECEERKKQEAERRAQREEQEAQQRERLKQRNRRIRT